MNVFIDIDIDIDIFKSDLIDIDIFKTCRYIDNRYGLSIYRTPLLWSQGMYGEVSGVLRYMKGCDSQNDVDCLPESHLFSRHLYHLTLGSRSLVISLKETVSVCLFGWMSTLNSLVASLFLNLVCPGTSVFLVH